jgi:hypothetical protein
MQRGHVELGQNSLRTRSCHVMPSPPRGRSASVQVSRLWTCRSEVSHAGHRASICMEETKRVIWLCASSMCQASSCRGMGLGDKWANVSRTSKNAKEPMLLYILHNYTLGTARGTAAPKPAKRPIYSAKFDFLAWHVSRRMRPTPRRTPHASPIRGWISQWREQRPALNERPAS